MSWKSRLSYTAVALLQNVHKTHMPEGHTGEMYFYVSFLQVFWSTKNGIQGKLQGLAFDSFQPISTAEISSQYTARPAASTNFMIASSK